MNELSLTRLGTAVAGILFSFTVCAAEVPAGTSLATQQNIVINNGTEVSSLDPQKVEGVPESNVILNLLEGLVSTDNNGHVVPGVATSWQQKGTEWIFSLRDDAKWSDGTPVTAEDLV